MENITDKLNNLESINWDEIKDEAYPVLVPGVYEFTVKTMTNETSKAGNSYAKVGLAMTGVGEDTQGNAIKAGYIVFTNIPLSATEKMSEERVLAGIKTFLKAIGVNQWDSSFQSYLGKRLFAKTKIEKGNDEFPDKATVAKLLPCAG